VSEEDGANELLTKQIAAACSEEMEKRVELVRDWWVLRGCSIAAEEFSE